MVKPDRVVCRLTLVLIFRDLLGNPGGTFSGKEAQEYCHSIS